MDEQGNETFDTSGALDVLRKVSLFPYETDFAWLWNEGVSIFNIIY